MRARTTLLAAILFLSVSCAVFRAGAPHYDRVVLASGVVVKDLVVPEKGPRARTGDLIDLHYEIRLEGGELVDSSYERGQPVHARLGDGFLPRGVEEGVIGMRLYGRRRLVVPPALGYGSEGLPPRIPGDARLWLVLELMGLSSEP